MEVNTKLLELIVGVFASLGIGTGIRLVAVRNCNESVAKQRMSSLKVWWVLSALLSLSALFGLLGATVLIAFASVLGLIEFLRLIGPVESIGKSAIAGLLICGTFQFGLILAGEQEMACWTFPVGSLVLFGAIRALAGNTKNYIRTTAALYWGAMLMIFAISHSLFLFDIQSEIEPAVGRCGWFLYLIILTEMNDIMQAIVGRKWGQQKITPKVSPNKSLEGLLGGFLSTIVLSVILAPYLTTFGMGPDVSTNIGLSATAGAVISLSGFLGDINMSAIKRDVGVKDGSTLFPGMGGMIDRIDSLTFSAPAFFYFLVFAKISPVIE